MQKLSSNSSIGQGCCEGSRFCECPGYHPVLPAGPEGRMFVLLLGYAFVLLCWLCWLLAVYMATSKTCSENLELI